jgi:hypothetical protein
MTINREVDIIVADLTHTAQTISGDFMPYGATLVASYLAQHTPFQTKFRLIKFPDQLESEFKLKNPQPLDEPVEIFVHHTEGSRKIIEEFFASRDETVVNYTALLNRVASQKFYRSTCRSH